MATDKEYLTFCNASNLDWQFAEIKKSEYKEKNSTVDRFPYISELLKPDNFAKEYKKKISN